ncbi:MAG: hypothetical protein ACFB5Z_18205 [Elainellaceae cyanobacterium]
MKSSDQTRHYGLEETGRYGAQGLVDKVVLLAEMHQQEHTATVGCCLNATAYRQGLIF